MEQEGHHEQVRQPRQVLHLSLVDSAEQRARAEAVIDCMRLLMSLCSGLLYYPHAEDASPRRITKRGEHNAYLQGMAWGSRITSTLSPFLRASVS